MLADNLFCCRIGESGSIMGEFFNVCFITNRIATAPFHSQKKVEAILREAGDKNIVGFITSRDSSGHDVSYPFSPSKLVWHRMPGTETCCVLFPIQVPERKKITQHVIVNSFIDNESNKVQETMMLSYRTSDGHLISQTVPQAKLDAKSFVDSATKEKYGLSYYWTYHGISTPGGSSGGILWSCNSRMQRRIFGCHSGVSENNSYDSVVSEEAIHQAVSLLLKTLPSPQNTDVVSHNVEIVSQCGTIADQQVAVGRVLHGNVLPKKNPACPSPLAPYLREQGMMPCRLPVIPRKFNPATVKQHYIDAGILPKDCPIVCPDQEISPLRLSEAKLGRPAQYVPISLLDATNHISDYHPRPYYVIPSMENCVFGNPSLKLDRIDMSASVGYPYATFPETSTRPACFSIPKHDLLKKTGFEEWKERIQNDLLARLDHYRNGRLFVPIYVNSLKIEPRTPDRVLAGKVRRFYASDVVSLTVSRVFLSSYWKAMYGYNTTQILVGVNPHSPQWGELGNYIFKFPNLMFLDMENWDLSIPYTIVAYEARQLANSLKFTEFVVQEPRLKDWSRDQLLSGIINSYMMATHAMDLQESTLTVTAGTTRSGTDGTSTRNSVWGRRKFRCCVHAYIIDNKVDTFGMRPIDFIVENTTFAAYGDDQAIGVSNLLKGFDRVQYAKYMKSLFNIVATMPDKFLFLFGFFDCKEVVFFKREFVLRDGFMYAPLQRDIIEDMLHWNSEKENSTANTIQTIRSAQLEAVHHGREYFDSLTQKIEYAVVKAGLSSQFKSLVFEEADYGIRHA
jgi:hypothetical protein